MNLTLATWITLSRLLGVPFLLWSLQEPAPCNPWWPWGVFAVASLTDWVDGYVARRWHQVSDLGKILDPLVDKLLVLAPLLPLLAQGKVPAWGVYVILARELIIAGWRSRQTQVTGANRWGKAKTVSQIVAILLLLLPFPALLPLAQGTFYLAVILTITSGVLYITPLPQEQSHLK
jgi:CDP-diacylglycerol--glycerol-3-phosphate 3-phosphatidyltransferase